MSDSLFSVNDNSPKWRIEFYKTADGHMYSKVFVAGLLITTTALREFKSSVNADAMAILARHKY